MYQLCELNRNEVTPTAVIRLTDKACIPLNADNTDAHEFGLWLKAGNIPSPAEGTTLPENFVVNTLQKLGISQ